MQSWLVWNFAIWINQSQNSETCLSPLDVFDQFNFKELEQS